MISLRQDDPIAVAPVWHVCFTGNIRVHWWDRFLAAGFRHVFMLGYLPGRDAWLFYDVSVFTGTSLAVLDGPSAGALLSRAVDEGGVLSIAARPEATRPAWMTFGFWCVPSALHLLGLRCVAVTPKGLHDKLLKLGAKPFPEAPDGKPARR